MIWACVKEEERRMCGTGGSIKALQSKLKEKETQLEAVKKVTYGEGLGRVLAAEELALQRSATLSGRKPAN
ncbi:hypothetical protein CYMTET_17216 [Cymbomonas tetramitiformis]|uniref:Uncharacterized protein n=1 Tax=Cymbomonas tetramitiformis TaxID=36881 RepID=A0AAE0GAU7_9CHLO|nr:hypothetical protein CYMTET_17216 [Cymbomonas tetramitiformis]